MGVTKPFLDSLAKDFDARQETAALKAQLRARRGWLNLLKKHPAPQAPSVPAYASGGQVDLGMGYTGWGGGERPRNPPPTYDVIPGAAPSRPSFTVVDKSDPANWTPQERRYVDLLAQKNDSFSESVLDVADRLNPAAAAYEGARDEGADMRPSDVRARLNRWGKQKRERDLLATRAFEKLSDAERQAIAILAEELQRAGQTTADLDRYFTKKKGRRLDEGNLSGPTQDPVAFTLQAARVRLSDLEQKQREVNAGKSPELATQELQSMLAEQQQGSAKRVGPRALRDDINPAQAVTGESAFVPPSALNRVRDVPVVGDALAEGIEATTSPLAIATAPLMGGLGGAARNVAAVTAARTAAKPFGPGAETAAGLAADVLVGGPSGPGRVADDVAGAVERNVPDLTRTAEPSRGLRPDVLEEVPRPGIRVPAQYADSVSMEGSNAFVRTGTAEIMFTAEPDGSILVTPRVHGSGVSPDDIDVSQMRDAHQAFKASNPSRPFVMNDETRRVLEGPALASPRLGAADIPRTAERVAEAPRMAGGAQLTPDEIAARTQPPIPATFASKPAREAREGWRRYEGALRAGTIQQNNWMDETYRLARQSKTPIIKGAKEPTTQGQVDLMERVFGAGNRRDPVGGFMPNQRETIQRVYEYFDDTTNLAVAKIPDFDQRALPEYTTHLFTQRNIQKTGKGGINLRPGFLKHREATGTLGDILRARPDLDLATWDPIELAVLHRRSVESYIAGLNELRDLKALGLIRPVEAGLPGWRTPDISTFSAKMGKELSGWVAHPQVATRLEQQFTKGSLLDQHGIFKAAKSLRETLFKLKVAGGLFQGIDFTARAVGRGTAELAKGHPLRATRAWFSPIHSVARASIPGLDRALLKRAENNPILMAGYRNGLSAGVDTSLADTAIRGLGSFVPQTVMGKQIPGAKPLQQVLEFVSGGAYEKFHRDMLEQDFLVNFEKFKRQIDLPGGGFGKRTDIDDIARRAAEDTNVFYSSLPNWQSAIRSATGRDVAKIGFFAPGELEAWFRLPFQSPAGFAGIIGSTVIAAELLNKHFTGEWLGEDQILPYTPDKDELARFKKDPASLWKSGVPGVDYNTKFLRPQLPWDGPDGRHLYLDLLGQADTPFRWALDPKFALQTRMGQLPSAAKDAIDISSGIAPAFGEKVEGPMDALRWAGQEVSPIALQGFGGTERGRIGTLATGVQAGGVNISAEPIGERRNRAIAEEYAAGKFTGEYDGVPEYGDIIQVPSDLAYFREKYPNLTTERSDAFQKETLENQPESARRAEQKARRDSAKQYKSEGFEEIRRNAYRGQRGDVEEQEARKGYYTDIKTTKRDYFAVLKNEDLVLDIVSELEPSSREAKALNIYYGLLEKLPRYPTNEDWDAFEAAYNALPESQRTIIEFQTGVNDHAIEKATTEFNNALEPYYELPEGKPREAYRKKNPEVDGILWAIGGTSKVMSPGHRKAAVDAYEKLYGVRIDPGKVSLGKTSGSSSGSSGSTSNQPW